MTNNSIPEPRFSQRKVTKERYKRAASYIKENIIMISLFLRNNNNNNNNNNNKNKEDSYH